MASNGQAGGSANGKIGLGFVGVGGRGQSLLRAALKSKDVEVVALCDLEPANIAKAAEAVKTAGGKTPASVGDWQSLLALPGVDAVVSALPCDLHGRNYVDTISAGKDLYAEKPMCVTVEACDAVVAATNASDRIVQIGFQRRADPRFVETMRLVHEGELGDLVEGRIAWSNAWGPLYGWFGKIARSGDWMVEQAVHNWDVMNWANGSLPVRAMGLGRGGYYRDKQPDRDVHDYYSAIVEYANGVVVNIMHSWLAPGKQGAYNKAFNDEYTRLIGTRAGIDFNTGTFSYRRELDLPDRIGHTVKGEIDNTALCVRAFIDSVKTRKPPVATASHGRAAVLACLLVRAAVERGGAVTMAELEVGK